MEPKNRTRAPRDPERQRDGLDAIGAGLALRIPVEYDEAGGRPAHAAGRERAGEDFSVRIAVAIARMEERQIAMQDQHRSDQSAADARHGQLVSMIAAFVPRSEIEATNKRLTEDIAAGDALLRKDITALDERMKGIEGRAWKLIAWVLGVVGSAIAGMFGLHLKSAG